jgi:signal transduction histidine kinase
MFNLFDHITPIYLLYLFYGAVFLFLGVSIAAKDMKGSDLQLADSLWMLGMFGFLHGAHEWLELGPLIEGKNLSFQQIFMVKAAAALLVLLSFMFLLQFGISLVRVLDDKRIRWVKAVPAPLFLIWTLYFWYYGFHNEGSHIDMQSLRQADLGARYTFGFVGGLVTAYGLVANSREVKTLSRPASQKLYYAGITFALYAAFAGLFPSNYQLPFLPVPIEVFRSMAGFLITYFIAKTLNIFDIEARKKIEQHMRRIVQVEKLSSLGQLAAGIAHEINNPLTNASLGIQTLRRKMKSAGGEREFAEKLDAVERNIDKASTIARELLEFSRQKDAEFVPLDVNDMIRGAITLLSYKSKNVDLSQELTPVSEVMGDPRKLEQVVINVLSNSVEAMPEGGTIAVSTRQEDGLVKIRIADRGPGIPEEHLSQVFDPFFTTKEIGAGTGLGLSICYGIMSLHHGTIELASAPGKGTTVTISLPAKERTDL